MKRMFNLLLTILVAYVTIVALMFTLQRLLLYHPNRNVGAPALYGLHDFTESFTTTADGVSIQLWYRPAKENFPTIAHFHGNAYNISDRAGIYAALAGKGFGVLAVSYRGYGKSEGYPSEEGLYHDARAALAFLKEKNIPAERIMLYGESLGTGVATQMATEHPVGAVILQSPYLSVEDRASELYSFIPVRMLIKDKFRTIDKIGKVKALLILFHGELDTIIPVAHGRALLEAANEPKEAHFFPHIEHNNFDSALISEHVLTLARKHQLIK